MSNPFDALHNAASSGAAASAGGAAATGAATAGGSAFGLAGLKAALNPWTIGFQLVGSQIQRYFQDREERKQKRMASEAASSDPRHIDAGATIPRCYGPSKFPIKAFYSDRNKGIPLIPQADTIGTMTPSVPGGDYVWGKGNQCRLGQFAVSGGRVRVNDVLVNGRSTNHRDYRGLIIAEVKGPGESSDAVTQFTTSARHPHDQRASGNKSNRRTATATGDGFTKINVFVNHLPSKLTIKGTPTIEPIGTGVEVRTIQSDNTLSTTRRYSTNLSEAMLDFFLDDFDGLNFPVEELDLKRIRERAQNRAAQIVDGPGAANDSEMQGNDNPLGIARETIAEARRRVGLAPGVSGLANSHSFANQDAANKQPILRHEYAGNYTIRESSEQIIENMLRTAPGMVIAESEDGWYWDIPDSTRTEAAQSVANITDTDLYNGHFQITSPSADTIVTRVTADFADIDRDFRPSTVVFPPIGSSAETQLNAAVGNTGPYERTLSLRGVYNKKQARTVCRMIVAESLRDDWAFPLHKSKATMIPGDVVACSSRLHGQSAFVRILTRTRVDSQHYVYTGKQFDKDDYDYIIQAAATFDLEAQESSQPVAPDKFDATVLPSLASVRLDWSWTETLSTLAAWLEIESKYGTGEWQPESVVSINALDFNTTYTDKAVPPGNAQYRAKTIFSNLKESSYVESKVVVVPEITKAREVWWILTSGPDTTPSPAANPTDRTVDGSKPASAAFQTIGNQPPIASTTASLRAAWYVIRDWDATTGWGDWSDWTLGYVRPEGAVTEVDIPAIYKRLESDETIADAGLPRLTYRWTFNTNTGVFLTSGANNDWHAAPPPGDGKLVTRRTGVVRSPGEDTQDIAPSEWGPAEEAGVAGRSFGLARLWAASDTELDTAGIATLRAALPATVDWEFADNEISTSIPSSSVWNKTLSGAAEDGKQYVYLAAQPVSGLGDSVEIARSDWDIGLAFRVAKDGDGQETIHRRGTIAELAAFRADRAGWSGRPSVTRLYDPTTDQGDSWFDNPDDDPDEDNPVAFTAFRLVPLGVARNTRPPSTATARTAAGWTAWTVFGVKAVGEDGTSVKVIPPETPGGDPVVCDDDGNQAPIPGAGFTIDVRDAIPLDGIPAGTIMFIRRTVATE